MFFSKLKKKCKNHRIDQAALLPLIVNNLGYSNGQLSRPKTLVALLLLFLSSIVHSQSETTAIQQSIDYKLYGYIAGLFLAYAAVPLIRHVWQARTRKKSYKAFLKSSIDSTFIRYGKEASIDFARRNYVPQGYENTEWLDYLDKQGRGTPELLLHFHEALKKSLTSESIQKGYVPYITYDGMPTSSLDHEHPIWLFGKKDSEKISRFLLSQSQIEKSIATLYTRPFSKFSKSKDTEDRARWVSAAYKLLYELSEHYQYCLELEQHLGHSKT